MDSQALALNNIIEKQNPNVLKMLSQRGKNIFFPKLGILSQAAQAKGKKINATIGEAVEDDGTSMHLPEFDSLVNLPGNSVFPYAPSFGKPDLRELWKKMIYEKNPSLKDTIFSKPIATNGLTHGISMTGYLFADEGDSVIMSDLYWENYNLLYENGYNAKVETFSLFSNGSFNVDAFSKKINESKKDKVIILLNFPNNPSGYTPLINEISLIVNEIKAADPNLESEAVSLNENLVSEREKLLSIFQNPQSSDTELLEQINNLILTHSKIERILAEHVLVLRPYLTIQQQKWLIGLGR